MDSTNFTRFSTRTWPHSPVYRVGGRSSPRARLSDSSRSRRVGSLVIGTSRAHGSRAGVLSREACYAHEIRSFRRGSCFVLCTRDRGGLHEFSRGASARPASGSANATGAIRHVDGDRGPSGGEAQAGRQAFLDLKCTVCHRVVGETTFPAPISGTQGPDLDRTLALRPAADVAAAIVVPSHSMSVKTSDDVKKRLEGCCCHPCRISAGRLPSDSSRICSCISDRSGRRSRFQLELRQNAGLQRASLQKSRTSLTEGSPLRHHPSAPP